MAESFRCPSCSAPLEFEGKPLQKCRFCGGNVIVPADIVRGANAFGGAGNLDLTDLSALTGKALKIAEIQRLIQSGNKINAIKVFRETFGVGLKEAKDAVDAMEEGRSLDLSGMQILTTSASVNLQSNEENLAEIQRLVRGGSKIEAIKRFREMTNVGLKEAKDAVEAIERGEHPDISRMQSQPANTRLYIQNDASNVRVRKANASSGGSLLTTFLITAALIIGAIGAIFYLVSSSVNKAIDKSFPTEKQPVVVSTERTAGSEDVSIARELLKFGGEGTGAGKFKDNRAIAVDADGKIYSADFSGGRTQVFDGEGKFLQQIMTDASRTVDTLAVDRKGNLFVLQGYDVYRVDKESGETLGMARVNWARDLAVGLDGKIYVATFRNGVEVLNADGSKFKNIAIGKDLNLESLEQIAVDGANNLFLLDGKTGAIFKLAPDGKLLTRFGGRSNESMDKMPKTQFDGGAHDIAIDSAGRVFVSQISRVSIFDADGNFIDDFKTTQTFGMAFSDKDELFVAARPYVVKYKVNL